MIDLAWAFEKHDDTYCKFKDIKDPPNARPDISAFIYLDRLLPNPGRDMVSAAEHDEIYLGIDCEKLAEVATEDDVIFLSRCGVRFDEGLDSLCMFV